MRLPGQLENLSIYITNGKIISSQYWLALVHLPNLHVGMTVNHGLTTERSKPHPYFM